MNDLNITRRGYILITAGHDYKYLVDTGYTDKSGNKQVYKTNSWNLAVSASKLVRGVEIT